MLLTTDLHLDTAPDCDYRWEVFDHIVDYFQSNDDRELCILGDLTDKRDLYSKELVNRLFDQFQRLQHVNIIILMGNHDAPLNGSPYWKFISQISHLKYITQPTGIKDRLYLPYAKDPATAWADLDFDRYDVAFFHQTISGAMLERGMAVPDDKGDSLPKFPRHMRLYSGDVHTPQTLGNLVYVGAPHPVKYGDQHRCRMLVLDAHYDIMHEIKLQPPRKHVLKIKSVEDLEKLQVAEGDFARVSMELDPKEVQYWPEMREQIADWAKEHGVSLTQNAGHITLGPKQQTKQAEASLSPRQAFDAYADEEGLDDALYEAGLALLNDELEQGEHEESSS